MNEQTSYHYDAFISYRHAQPDGMVAQKLHRLLESYRLPSRAVRQLQQQFGAEAKTKISRVFRDEEELPTSSSLGDQIAMALDSTEWLIVICSPRLPLSQWCRKEIDTFISLRGTEHVMAVLVEGDVETACPEPLRFREVTETDAEGRTITRQEPWEPLMIDVRSADKKDMEKKLKEQFLVLLARMVGMPYEELRQRHAERKNRRWIAGAGVVTAASVLFGAYVWNNSRLMEKKNAELEEKQLVIQEKNDSLLQKQAVTLAEEAMERYHEDDRTGCASLAYEALTEYNGTAMPYTDEARFALMQGLDPYDFAWNKHPISSVELNGEIEDILMNNHTPTVAIYDSSRTITLWNPLVNRVIRQIEYDQKGDVNPGDTMAFIGGYYFAYLYDGDVIVVDSVLGKRVATVKDLSVEHLVGCQDRDVCFGFAGSTLYRISVIDGKQVIAEEYMTGMNEIDGYAKNVGDFLIWFMKEDSGEDELCFLQIDEGWTDHYEVEPAHLVDVCEKDGSFYLTINVMNEARDAYTGTWLCRIDIGKKETEAVWRFETDICYAQQAEILTDKDGRQSMLVRFRNTCMILDADSGDLDKTYTASTRLIGMQLVAQGDCIVYSQDPMYNPWFYFEDGVVQWTNMDTKQWERERKDLVAVKKYEVSTGIIAINDHRALYYDWPELDECMQAVEETELPVPMKTEVLLEQEAVKRATELGVDRPALVTSLLYDDKKTTYYVSWSTGDLAVYREADRQLLQQWKAEKTEPLTAYLGVDQEGNAYVTGKEWGYCLSPNHQRIANIRLLYSIDAEKGVLGLRSDKTFYTAPIFTKEALLAKAKEKLGR